MESKIYNLEGKETGTLTLPEAIFGLSWNGDLVHQVVTSMRTSARTNLAHTKDRSEVRGGGKKPWAQKGTGRSRHGSSRSPIWRGGGITHGPRNEKNFDRKVNKKMKMKALNTILSQKLRDGEIIFIDSFDSFKEPKTAVAKKAIDAIAKGSGMKTLATKRKNAAYIAISDTNSAARKSFANFSNMYFDEVRNINPVDILNYKYIIFAGAEASLETLSARLK
jgi:large subunit ribosomal protein L4